MTEEELAAWDRACQLEAEAERQRLKAAEEEHKHTQHQYKWYRTLVVILLVATNWIYITSVTQWFIGTGHEAVFTYSTLMMGCNARRPCTWFLG